MTSNRHSSVHEPAENRHHSGANGIKGPRLNAVLVEAIAAYAAVFFLAVSAARMPGAAATGPALSDASSLLFFFSSLAAATALVALLLRSFKGSRAVVFIFALAVFSGIGTLAERLWGVEAALFATSFAVLCSYGLPYVAVFDAVLLAGVAGIALNLGSGFNPAAVAILLAILAWYDIFSVYVTGHMVSMAAAMLRQRAFFAIILPGEPSGFLRPIRTVAPEQGFMFLGTGDVLLPAMFAVSAASRSMASAVSIMAGAFIGLAAAEIMFRRQALRKPMPALPPIALFSILGYLFSLVVGW